MALTVAAAATIRAEIADAKSDCAQVSAPPGWPILPAQVSFEAAQRGGPLGHLVLARAMQVVCATVDKLAQFCRCAIAAEDWMSSRDVLDLAAAQAQPAGRSEAVQDTHQLATEVVNTIVGGSWWLGLLASLGAEGPQDDDFAAAVGALLHHAIGALLVTECLRDVATDTLLRAGRGPWMWAQHHGPGAPGDLWLAPATARAQVNQLVADLGPLGLISLAERHRASAIGGTSYEAACAATQDAAITQPISFGAAQELTGSAAEALAGALDASPRPGELLQAVTRVLDVLTAACALGTDLPPEHRAALRATFSPVGAVVPVLLT